MINITINGKSLSVAEGTTILEAARTNGIVIPTLCYLKDINAIGAYQLMSDALRESGRPIFLSMCEWGTSKPWELKLGLFRGRL